MEKTPKKTQTFLTILTTMRMQYNSLLLGRKVMTNLDSILKSRAITSPTKVCIVKAMVFPVIIYRYENWTIKKPEVMKNRYL